MKLVGHAGWFNVLVLGTELGSWRSLEFFDTCASMSEKNFVETVVLTPGGCRRVEGKVRRRYCMR